MKHILKYSILLLSLGFTVLTGCIKEDADLPPVKSLIIDESFTDSLGTFSQYSVTGAQVWTASSYSGTTYAQMSGYSGSYNANEDWLISKPVNFDNYTDEILNFQSAMKYGLVSDTSLKVFYSKDYIGTGDPNLATWTRISPVVLSSGNFTWFNSGDINLSGVTGTSVYIAFKYVCTTSNVATWELTAIKLKGSVK